MALYQEGLCTWPCTPGYQGKALQIVQGVFADVKLVILRMVEYNKATEASNRMPILGAEHRQCPICKRDLG